MREGPAQGDQAYSPLGSAPLKKGVLLKYPLSFRLDSIRDHPSVAMAKRCVRKRNGEKVETPSVEIHLLVQSLPKTLDLGWAGTYQVREYVAEPTRCYRCQKFGHVAKHCRHREVCGACSQSHPTAQCLEAWRQNRQRPASKCPNCRGSHHAWFRRCPERMMRLPDQAPPPTRAAQRQPAPRQQYIPAPPPVRNAWQQRAAGQRDREALEPAPPPPRVVRDATLPEPLPQRPPRVRRRVSPPDTQADGVQPVEVWTQPRRYRRKRRQQARRASRQAAEVTPPQCEPQPVAETPLLAPEGREAPLVSDGGRGLLVRLVEMVTRLLTHLDRQPAGASLTAITEEATKIIDVVTETLPPQRMGGDHPAAEGC